MIPDAPVFLVQLAYTGRDRLPKVADERDKAGRKPPGILYDFGAVHLPGIREAHRDRGKLSPALACSVRYDHIPKRGPGNAGWVRRPGAYDTFDLGRHDPGLARRATQPRR